MPAQSLVSRKVPRKWALTIRAFPCAVGVGSIRPATSGTTRSVHLRRKDWPALPGERGKRSHPQSCQPRALVLLSPCQPKRATFRLRVVAQVTWTTFRFFGSEFGHEAGFGGSGPVRQSDREGASHVACVGNVEAGHAWSIVRIGSWPPQSRNRSRKKGSIVKIRSFSALLQRFPGFERPCSSEFPAHQTPGLPWVNPHPLDIQQIPTDTMLCNHPSGPVRLPRPWSNPAEFGRSKPKSGQHRPEIGRHRPKFGQLSSGRIRSTFGGVSIWSRSAQIAPKSCQI